MSAASTFASKPWLKKAGSKWATSAKSPDKLGYAYLLTPTGVAEKSALTRRFLQRKMAEYEKLRGEIEALQLEAGQPSPSAPVKSNS